MLTRDQFKQACNAFARQHPQWSFVSGHHPGYGFLSRATQHTFKSPINVEAVDLADLELEEEDAAAAPPASVPSVNVQEYIVYSASFNVPAFYFFVHDSHGSSLPLNDILQTSFFKVKPPRGSEASDFALTLPTGSFPLLSQGDHPTLGTTCWYFHPCETDTAVNEFLAEVEEPGWDEEMRLTRWIELWLMIVGSILNV